MKLIARKILKEKTIELWDADYYYVVLVNCRDYTESRPYRSYSKAVKAFKDLNN